MSDLKGYIWLIWGLYMMKLRFKMKDFRFGKVRV